jgi:hypothetical protein
VRSILGKDVAVYLGDTFEAEKFNDGFWQTEEFDNTFLDSHYYQGKQNFYDRVYRETFFVFPRPAPQPLSPLLLQCLQSIPVLSVPGNILRTHARVIIATQLPVATRIHLETGEFQARV